MCGRYGQVQEQLSNFFEYRGIQLNLDLYTGDNFNTSHSNLTTILSYDENGRIQQDRAFFGHRPWYGFKKDPNDKSKLWIDPETGRTKFDYSKGKANINARAEGKQGKEQLNPSNDPLYVGPYNIFKAGGFSSDIKKHRCIIPASFFIEGPKKERLDKPFLIEKKDRSPISLAGFYSRIQGINYVAIITTPAAELLQKVVGHHRSPQILKEENESLWMDRDADHEDLGKLFGSFDSKEYHAFPIGKEIKSPNTTKKPNNSVELIKALDPPSSI